MVKPNYGFQKRQRELAKKQKKEAKRQRAAGTEQATPEAQAENASASETGDSSPSLRQPAPD